MTVHPSVRGFWFLFLVLLGGGLSICRAQGELPPEIDSDGVQTLTRGPVHEAFASPTIADPKPGLVVPKAPPADIKEQPPEYQPEGQNVQWFPGYWAWDEDRDDFIWISGAWRDPPPGKRWVPGYWAQVNGGFQWVAGFWIDEQVEEFEYLKTPPASLEQGPSTASPGDDYFYVPGAWTYIDNDYRWTAGYWAPYREDWVYVQPHWVWTPRGCVFVAGYWDWRLPRRGQIFAPVYVTPVVYQRPTYYYTPRCVINTSNLFVHLWVRDSYCHYYFGNYYGPTYAQRHFTPWCNYNSRPHCHDPLFTYCHVHYRRQGINYADRMRGWHHHYVNHVHERPANTWRDQIKHQQHDHDRDHQREYKNRPAALGEDLKNVVQKPEYRWKKQDLAAKDQTRQTVEQVKQLHNLRLREEKVSLANRDVPGRNDNDRNDRPNRGPALGDPSQGPDLKLPATKPGHDNPADKIAATQHALTGKLRLPKAPTANLPNKAKIEVPETPDRNVVSRPNVENPLNGNKPKPNLPDKPSRLSGSRNPGGNFGPQIDKSANATVENPLLKPTEKPLTTREPKKPDLGGNNSSTNALQQRIDAIRQQQQDALNNARKPKIDLGGNPARSIDVPKVNPTPKLETGPKIDTTPKIERTPKIELPKREVTRPPLSSGSSNPSRSSGNSFNGGINLGGNKEPKSSGVPRSFTPSVEPRITKPNIERPQPTLPSRQNSIQQLQPRNSTPRVNPGNSNNNGGGNNNEKKRNR